MGLLALPAMLSARYDTAYASGVICAGGTLGILIPPSIMLIVYAAATSGVSVVRMYAGALLPGLLLAGLYLVYVVGRRGHQIPSLRRSRPRKRSAIIRPRARLDAADVLRAPRRPHPGGARRDPVRLGDAVGSRRAWRSRRHHPRHRLWCADLAAAAEGRSISRSAPRRWSAGCSSAPAPSRRSSPNLGGQQLITDFVTGLDMSP